MVTKLTSNSQGSYMDPQRTQCLPCDDGKISSEKAAECVQCPSQKEYTNDKINCRTCDVVSKILSILTLEYFTTSFIYNSQLLL